MTSHTVEERNGYGPWRPLVTYYYDSGYEWAAKACEMYRTEAAKNKGLWEYRVIEADGTVCIDVGEPVDAAARRFVRDLRAGLTHWPSKCGDW